jgi:excisionase family DNA binding protein
MSAPAPKLVGPPILNPVAAVASRLGVSPQYVRDLIKTGRLRAVRLGKSVLVPEHELDRFAARLGPVDEPEQVAR